MVIKSTRIRTSSGTGALLRHLRDGTDNEAITIIAGTIADMEDAVDDAKRFGRTYAVRHFIIAPALHMNRHQFTRSAQALANEFGFELAGAYIVEHRKPRAVAEAGDTHWHLVVPEVDASGRVLSSSHDRARHEKISRSLELEFGHPIVPGAHDRAVLVALRDDGQENLADTLAARLGHGPKPVEAFTSTAHQAAKKDGFDLALLKQHVRVAFDAAQTGIDFHDRLAVYGLTATPGDKLGVWVVHTTTGTFLGSGHRLAGTRRAAFNQKMETIHDQHRHPDNRQRSAGHPDGYASDPHRPEHHSAAGRGDGAAETGRTGLVLGNHDQSVAHDRGGRRAEPEVLGIAAPEAGRSWDRYGSTPGDGNRLIEAFQATATEFFRIGGSGIGETFDHRTARHLAGIEAQARADISAARNRSEPTMARLEAARYFERSATKSYDELWQRYRAIDEELAVPLPRPKLFDRLTGRKLPNPVNTVALEREQAAVRGQMIEAQRTMLSGIASAARAEKDHAAAHATWHRETQALVHKAELVLAEVSLTRQVVAAYPRLVWCGPAFTIWTGQKIERGRRKRERRNPGARNIWGLPMEP